jgi:hypothetical protein
MRKIVMVAGVVAVLGVGVGFIGYNLVRTGGQIGRIGAELPAPRDAAARVQQPRPTEPRAAPVAAPAVRATPDTPGEPHAEPTADERSPFGHAGEEQVQADHVTTIAEGPPREATGDATSLAPLLTDAHATLEQLLADAAGDPDARAELVALLGDGAAFDALLEDPDPAVREEAAKLLEVLGRAPQ